VGPNRKINQSDNVWGQHNREDLAGIADLIGLGWKLPGLRIPTQQIFTSLVFHNPSPWPKSENIMKINHKMCTIDDFSAEGRQI
jgi:hypothetical protein